MIEELKESYVIDCNVAIKWFLPEEHASEALTFLEDASKNKTVLYAPEIIIFEFVGVLTKYNRLQFLTSQECRRYFTEFNEIISQNILKLISSSKELEEIFEFSIVKKILYNDAEYLYLSRSLKVRLITYDKHLSKIANR